VAPKSRIIERLLLDNGSVATNPTPLSGQQLNAFNRQRIYTRPLHGNATIVSETDRLTDRKSQCDFDLRQEEFTRVKAGSNTSTATLRVVGGDEKGSLESETVK
jgi:hypothetical protein